MHAYTHTHILNSLSSWAIILRPANSWIFLVINHTTIQIDVCPSEEGVRSLNMSQLVSKLYFVSSVVTAHGLLDTHNQIKFIQLATSNRKPLINCLYDVWTFINDTISLFIQSLRYKTTNHPVAYRSASQAGGMQYISKYIVCAVVSPKPYRCHMMKVVCGKTGWKWAIKAAAQKIFMILQNSQLASNIDLYSSCQRMTKAITNIDMLIS